ncbi:hypothetical protein MIMGU_mgv1a022442mg, partial [Erythranthe guttata]
PVCLSRLKKLHLLYPDFGNDEFNILKMNTPALDYLEIADRLPVHVEFGQLTSLIEANINLFEDVVQEDCLFYSLSLLEFIDTLYNIIDSALSAWTTKFQKEGWMEPPRQVPTCLVSHLKIIKIATIKGKKHEFEIIRYVLRNAKVLETMEIAHGSCIGFEKKFNMLQEISRFRRGSTACEVAFVRDVKGLRNQTLKTLLL